MTIGADYFSDELPTEPRFVPVFAPDLGIYPIESEYKVALIPMHLTKKHITFVEKRTVDNESFNMATINPNLVESVYESLVSKIKAACEAGARVVCCSEYCYPLVMHDKLSKELAALSQQHRSYIVAGSSVNTDPLRRAYNTSFIFTPSRSNPEPLSQHKTQAGWLLGELEGIEVPTLKTVKVLHTQYGTMAVLICASTTDKDIQYGLRYLNSMKKLYEPIDLVVSIAYSAEAAKMQSYSEYISGFAKTCVAFVNDMTYGDLCGLYVCGEQQIECLHPPELLAAESAYGPIHLYSLDLTRARNKRIEGLPAPCHKDSVK